MKSGHAHIFIYPVYYSNGEPWNTSPGYFEILAKRRTDIKWSEVEAIQFAQDLGDDE